MKHVFISYQHTDGDFAELVISKIEKAGFGAWVDSDQLQAGEDWRAEIDTAIKSACALIVIMTPEAKASEYVTYEWSFAWGAGVKVIPILYKDTKLHPRLESLQYLNFTNRTGRPWDALINIVKKAANTTTSPSPPLLSPGTPPSFSGVSQKTKEQWLELGNIFFERKEYNEALEAYEQAIRLAPGDITAYNRKGATLGKLERYDEALDTCKQAIFIDPNNADAYVNKSEALSGLKRYEEALTASEQAIRLAPNSVEAYSKGNVLRKEKAEMSSPGQHERTRHITCLVALPFKDSQTFAYETVLLPALRAVLGQDPYYWQVVRADEKYYHTTVVDNVGAWMKRAHAYIADISDVNLNVMMELGYMLWAKEAWQPIIVLERAQTGKHLADLGGVIRIPYPAVSGRYAVSELAEVFKSELAKDEGIQKFNHMKKEYYLSPMLLRDTFGVNYEAARDLAATYVTMEAFIAADVDEIQRHASSLPRYMANGLLHEVAERLKELKASS